MPAKNAPTPERVPVPAVTQVATAEFRQALLNEYIALLQRQAELMTAKDELAIVASKIENIEATAKVYGLGSELKKLAQSD